MGQCLRGKMADAGLVPPVQTIVADSAEASAPPAVAEPEVALVPEEAIAEPELDVTPPAAEASPADTLVAATFGLLRAEPDGSVVIAGSGTPGSEVVIYSNGTPLGRATVESSGDWVLVPDAPLPPGGVEITLGEEGKAGAGEQSFIVVIDEDKASQPLVVASIPGKASDILQGLVRTPAATPATSPAIPASAPAMAASEPADTQVAATEAEAADAAPADGSAEPAMQVASLPEPATAEPEAPAATPAPVAAPAATDSEPANDAEPAAEADPAPAAEPAVQPDSTVAPVAQPETAPATPPQAASVETMPPTIDAIEVEGDRSFFAGGGPEGGTVRLYIEDTHIADAEIAEGRWLIEAGNVLTKPNQRVRVDLLKSGSADVLARAEVDFVLELSDETPATAVADASDAVTEPSAEPEPEASEAAPAGEATEPAAETEMAEAAIEAPAPASAPATDAAPAADAASSAGSPAAEAQPAAAAAEPEAAPEPAVPTMVAVSVGDPDAQRFGSGMAIIRRGDNLWTIARRVYGEGVKYTTIYQANTGQIRDPDRIYPGQVFQLPAAD